MNYRHPDLLSMEFSRQEFWSGLPFPFPQDLLNPGIEPGSPALQADSLPSEPPNFLHVFSWLDSSFLLMLNVVVVQSLSQSLCNPMDHNTPGFPFLHYFLEFAQTHVYKTNSCLLIPSSRLILYCSLLFLLSIFPSIKVFSNKLALCIRWPKYWSFSFSISPSNKYSGLISFRIDWFDFLAV